MSSTELNKLKIAFHTLGCKVNIYESEVMQELVREAGASVVPFDGMADVYIVNTCTVTNTADKKSRSYLRRPRKINPEAIVAACGCYAQVEGEKLLAEGIADILIGADEKQDLVGILSAYIGKGIRRPVKDLSKPSPFSAMALHTLSSHTRADIKVQDGCNQFCSYCIIPYARGRIRSREIGDAVSEIRELSLRGVQEFVLTGIHLSSYGRDFPDPAGDELLKLTEAVHEIPGVKRIRFGSLEPRIVTEEFAKRLSALPKICPHFHLSLQSGSRDTLRRMNRHYTPEEYLESCGILRSFFDDPALTTDVIAGFPGETEREFSETCEFIRRAAFSELHVFKYSRRKGTAADRMPDQVPEEIKNERSGILIGVGEELSEAYRKRFIGREVSVLTEQKGMLFGQEVYFGYTKEYLRTAVSSKNLRENVIVSGKAEECAAPGILYLPAGTD